MPKVKVLEMYGGKEAAELRLGDGPWAVLTAPRAITWLHHQELPVDLVMRDEDLWPKARLLANGHCMSSTGFRLLVLEPKNFKPRPAFVMQDWGYTPDRCSSQVVRIGDIIVASGWGHCSEFFQIVFQVSEELFSKEVVDFDSFDASGWIPESWESCLLPPHHPLVDRALRSPSLWWVEYHGRTESLLTLCQHCGEVFDQKNCPGCGALDYWVAKCSYSSYTWDGLFVPGGCLEARAKTLFAENDWERECHLWDECPAGHACLSPDRYKKVAEGKFLID